jgi:phosphoserine phosphatase RsbU/P
MADTHTEVHISEDTILQHRSPHKARGEVVSSLVSDSCFVNRYHTVGEVSAVLTKQSDLAAIGVVDEDGKSQGIIIRSELFNLLGRPYGHDILRKRAIGDMATEVKTFHYERNIFSVSEEISEELRSDTEEYYLLVDDEDRFAGIFTARDMLIYLSDISQRDIAMARGLQRRIVKERDYFQSDTFELASVSVMAKGVGGDFYYTAQYGRGKHVFSCICDVSGKGVAASLVTSALWGIAGMFDFERGLSDFLTTVNTYLLHTFEGERFVTGIFVDFDPSSGEIRICDMGHSHLYLYRGEKLRKIRTNDKNPPLGVFAPIEPEINRMVLNPDDMVVILTDGLIEQTNSSGEEYPITRFAKHLKEESTLGLPVVLEAVLKDLTVFRGNQPQHDDVTMGLLRYTGTR